MLTNQKHKAKKNTHIKPKKSYECFCLSEQEKAQIEKEVKQRISESKEKNKTRHRCLVAGCNPYLENAEKATEHKNKTGHRTAKWPVRSKEGKRLAKERINGNYYKKYRGAKKIGTTWIIP